jgi:hypothetical protein
MSSQPTTKGDVLQRIGGIGLIIGGILTIVGNLMVPRPEDPSNLANYVKVFADDPDLARIAFVLVLLGLWALVDGFAAVYRSIPSGAGSAWARLGFYGIIAATSVFSVATALALATAKAAGAGTEATAASLIAAADSAFGVSVLAYWTALLFIGIGIAASSIYPKWIGWVLIIAGAVAAISGSIPRIFEASSEATELVFAAGALATSAMSLILGIIVTRREMKAM